MDIDALLASIHPRVRDSEQQERIRHLAERVSKAFLVARGKGVQAELTTDWVNLKSEFDKAFKAVQKETGLY